MILAQVVSEPLKEESRFSFKEFSRYSLLLLDKQEMSWKIGEKVVCVLSVSLREEVGMGEKVYLS